MCEPPREERHDAELCDRADKDIARTLQDKFEIRKTKGHAHAEHDDSEQNRDPWDRPEKRPRLKERDARDQYDEECHITRDKITELFECLHRCQLLLFIERFG